MKTYIATVQCDKCNWTKDKQNVYTWYNKQCPLCQNCIIITKKDLLVVKILQFLKHIGIVIGDNDKTEDPHIEMTINTNKLRK